jgi:serine O-acetyltransferase
MFPNLRRDIQRNLQDYEPVSPLKKMLLCLTLNSIHAVTFIRFQQWCARHGVPTFFAAKVLFYGFKIEISRHAKIGPGLRLPHPMGIIIGPNARVGADCDLYADVRLVLSHGSKLGPHLGNHVFLGDGAKVVGAVRIGNDAVIGVSSVVTKDIPSGVVAAGIPAKILTSKLNKIDQCTSL